MSHFTVLVIGDDVDAQLAPYHEFECTGINDEHVKELRYDLDELRADYAKNGDGTETFDDWLPDWIGCKTLGPGEEPDRDGDHKFGWIRVDEEGRVVEAVDRTNPDSKWDWYTVGGRWRGFFKARAGAEAAVGAPGVFGNEPHHDADVIRKGDVDWEGMRAEAAEQAGAEYDKVAEALGDLSWGDYLPWNHFVEKAEEDGEYDVDDARREYHAQAIPIALKEAKLMPWGGEILDLYGVSREVYVQRAVHGVAVPFALVKDGQWFESGKMGWFGISRDDMDAFEWNEQVAKLYDSLPDDTVLTLVDCHV